MNTVGRGIYERELSIITGRAILNSISSSILETPIEEFDEDAYKRYVLHLKATLNNDVSINSYLRDYITTMHFLMDEGYIPRYKMRAIKVDKTNIETYNDSELKILLKKPDIKKCSFNEYQCWVLQALPIHGHSLNEEQHEKILEEVEEMRAGYEK